MDKTNSENNVSKYVKKVCRIAWFVMEKLIFALGILVLLLVIIAYTAGLHKAYDFDTNNKDLIEKEE